MVANWRICKERGGRRSTIVRFAMTQAARRWRYPDGITTFPSKGTTLPQQSLGGQKFTERPNQKRASRKNCVTT